MKPAHIIFDCDGVLVDSEPLSMEIDYQLLKEHGVNLSRDEVSQRFIGLTFGALMEQVTRDFGIKLPADLSATKDKRLLALYERKLQPVAGALKAVEAISLPRSCASNSPRSRVAAAFRIVGLDRFFGARITTFEDVRHGKPAPDVYLEAAGRAGVLPEECVVVEDSVAGVTAAARAGCKVLGFTGTTHEPEAHGETLAKAGALKIFAHMDALPSLVQALNRA